MVSERRGAVPSGLRSAATREGGASGAAGRATIGTVIVYTDRRLAAPRDLATVARAVAAGGAIHVVLREKDLPDGARAALEARLYAEIGDLLLVSGVDGRHRDRTGRVIGRACHDRDELGEAAAEGAAYATLSPVFPTPSKPRPPLGLARLREACAHAPLPVYALGGIDSPERARACVESGAAGVAVLGAAMRAADPSTVVRRLVEAVCGSHRSR
jgi:thiamine-phosphate pyrophosphorylase/hydroxymethylpyrimidine kinase/phosphomethylpyrimidine kinase/thiamine-phosphate diphosphorylase